MANNDGWSGGATQGLTYGAAFNAADLNSLAAGGSVMSSIGDFNTFPDLYADFAFEFTIASATLVTCQVQLYIFDKFEIDGTNSYYGDNSQASGSQKAYQPAYGYAGVSPMPVTGAAQTVVAGMFKGILLPVGLWRPVIGNGLANSSGGIAIASSGNYCSYRTYRTNNNL